jgi:hypothetical protein
MFGFIRSISFAVQAMIPFLGLLLFGVVWFLPGEFESGEIYGSGYYYLSTEGWMYPLWSQMARLPLWARMAPSLVMAFVASISLVRTDLKHMVIGPRSYSIAYVFLFVLGASGHFSLFHPAMVAGWLMILSYGFLLDLYKAETSYSLVYGMGFSWGAAILLYPPVACLYPALLVGLLLMVSTSWRHWLASVTGVATPLLLAAGIWFLLGGLDYQVASFLSWFRLRDSYIPGFIRKEPFIAVWIGLLLIWSMIASVKYRNPKIQSRQLFQANFLLFICTLVLTVLLETISVEILWILSIPVTYHLTFWTMRVERKWKRELFFFSLVLSFALYRLIAVI